MAQSTATAVSVDEYHRAGYHPDVEYIDSQLKEKPVVGLPHGERLLSSAPQGMGIRVAVQTRTRVTE